VNVTTKQIYKHMFNAFRPKSHILVLELASLLCIRSRSCLRRYFIPTGWSRFPGNK